MQSRIPPENPAAGAGNEEPNSAHLQFYCPAEMRAEWERAALEEGVRLEDWVKRILNQAAVKQP